MLVDAGNVRPLRAVTQHGNHRPPHHRPEHGALTHQTKRSRRPRRGSGKSPVLVAQALLPVRPSRPHYKLQLELRVSHIRTLLLVATTAHPRQDPSGAKPPAGGAGAGDDHYAKLLTHNSTPAENPPTHAVIMAGGRGTRFGPRSRTRTPK